MKKSVFTPDTFLLGGEISINRMGFGAMRLTGPQVWGDPINRPKAQKVLKRGIELGVNFIDTADSYGPEVSENIIAETLYPYPKGLVIGTKGGLVRPEPGIWKRLGRPEHLIQCVEMSLRRLRLECIDLYQLHAIDPQVPLEESVEALRKMQQQGKIRFIGLSNVSVDEIERARKIIDVVSVQNQYNLLYRHSENVVDYCTQHALAFIPWYPIGRGELAKEGSAIQRLAQHKQVSPAQIALAWLLQHAPVMILIPGTASLEHLEENMAARSITLSDEEIAQLDALWDEQNFA